MKKKIVYIPSYYYLSHPVFFNIAKSARGKFHNVYFNTKEPFFAKFNKKGIKIEEVKKYFDEYYEVDESLLTAWDETDSKFKKFRKVIKNSKDLYNQLEKQLNLLDPDAIVTATDMGEYVNRMCNAWAEKNNVPFIIVQPSFFDSKREMGLIDKFGYLFFNKLLNIPLFRRQDVFGNERPKNYLFLWGNNFKNCYKGQKIEKNIYITGNPAFDPILNRRSIEDNLDKLGFNVPENKPVITICTQMLDEHLDEKNIRDTENLYRNLIKENPNFYFIVKIHPRQGVERYKKILDDLGGDNYTIVKKEDLNSLFKITDVQVSVASYSSFEAVVFGIPIILIKRNLTDFFDHFNNEIELRADTPEELSKHLKKCLTKEYKEEFKIKRKKYLESKLGYLDGKSSERVVKDIEKIIRRKNERESKLGE